MAREILRTSRLILQTWQRDDFHDAKMLWGDPLVMEFIDIRGGLNDEEVLHKLESEIDRQEEHNMQYWKIVTIDGGHFVGCCGLRPKDPIHDVYEIGFHIVRSFWGQGFAIEAAQGVIDYARAHLRLKKLFAGHNPSNNSSKEILLKLGFQYCSDEFYSPTGLYHPSYELVL